MYKIKTILMSVAVLIVLFSLAHADNAVLVKTIVGPDTLTSFGSAMATIKDFNGDGGIDLLIGAKDRSGSIGSPGWAYMYYGGSVYDSLWDVQYHGVQGRVGDYTGFGKAVSSAGAFNKDGYDDIVIGSPHYDDSLSSTWDDGRIYLYKGGPTPDTIPLWYKNHPHGDGAEFGYSVACLGDINKDGCSDIITGSPIDFKGGSMPGAAYIFLGDSINPDSGIDYELWGLRDDDFFGYSVGSCDLNGDGWKDVLVGAQGIETIPADTTILGRVYVYLGGAVFDTTCDLYYQGRQKGAHFGRSISSGDFNHDGYEDVIVGEYGYNNNTGRAYIYLGGASPDTVPDLILSGTQTGESFGYKVCGVGDLNDDSIDDYVASSPYYPAGSTTYMGKVLIYYGSSTLDTVPDMSISDKDSNSYFGYSIAGCGDINLDGKNEFALSDVGFYGNLKKVFIYNVDVNGIVGNENNINLTKLYLSQNAPNPFKHKTAINCQLPNAGQMNICMFNITGQLVRTLVKEAKAAGSYKIFWDGKNNNGEALPNGIYLYRLMTNNFTIIKKAILIK